MRVDVLAGGKTLATDSIGISLLARLRERLDRLQKLPAGRSLDAATLRSLTALLNGLAGGATPETDYPAGLLLEPRPVVVIAPLDLVRGAGAAEQEAGREGDHGRAG